MKVIDRRNEYLRKRELWDVALPETNEIVFGVPVERLAKKALSCPYFGTVSTRQPRPQATMAR